MMLACKIVNIISLIAARLRGIVTRDQHYSHVINTCGAVFSHTDHS